MSKLHNIVGFLLIVFFPLHNKANAQEAKSVNWLTFEQLEDSLNTHPKQLFIDFYTDWCTYCRKMDKMVFVKSDVIDLLNSDYYAVRFDAESDLEVNFGNQILINDQIGKSRNPVHQIAQALALRNGQFAPPVLVVLDENFNVTARYFEYMDSRRIIEALKK
ncbi:MAG: thioredoxin fold domain-containing protein [Bacteroidota bacterium]